MTKETDAPTPKTPRSRLSRTLLAGTVAVLGLGAIGAGLVAAQDAAPMLQRAAMGAGPMHGAMSAGPGEGPRGGMMHEARFGEGREHGGRMAAFMQWRLERTLEDVDASPEQIERVKAIAEEARADIAPMIGEFRGTREALAEILGAETLDRAAAETLRAERVATMEAVSARGLEAMLDAAAVLTPEQRAELAEEMGEHRRGWGRW
ncbi:Spy/CpxP family protein refolding chaperone [Salinarimonas sp.]|uniref:Spy/CpxP family protein refolding chaperone n=1 Tax=Salinarimonas sp. TaxID=2766526 RepID=UPI0032D97419